MRVLISMCLLVTLCVLSIGQVVAQQADEAKTPKRIAEIQKELGELQERIGKLTAELAKLQQAAKNPPLEDTPVIKGAIIQLVAGDKMTKGFYVIPDQGAGSMLVSLGHDTRIMYSNRQKAKPSDLKVGQSVSVGGKVVDFSPPPKAEADVIVIEKSVREILSWQDADADAVARQVDFATEYLLLFRWTGWSGYAADRVSFAVKEDKAGPVVVFNVTRPVRKAGMAKVFQQAESRLYVIAKSARVAGGPLGEGTKITSAKELAKVYADTK